MKLEINLRNAKHPDPCQEPHPNVPRNSNKNDLPNLFARLHPSTVIDLFLQAISELPEGWTSQQELEVGGSGWTVYSETLDHVQFLPLRVDLSCHGDVELSGVSEGSSTITLYCSYNGGFCDRENVIDISQSINPSLRDKHGFLATVHPLPYVRDATSLHVEPSSTSDWELMEVHAEVLEDGMLLDQLTIVYPGQMLTLHLGRNGEDVVHLRVLEDGFGDEHCRDEECLRLVAETELIVVPNPRRMEEAGCGQDDICDGDFREQDHLPSAPVRVLPSEADLSSGMLQLHGRFHDHIPRASLRARNENGIKVCMGILPSPPLFTIWMHPKTLLNIPGWDAGVHSNRDGTCLSSPSGVVHALVRKASSSRRYNVSRGGGTGGLDEDVPVIAHLVSSEIVPIDCAVMHLYLRIQLRLLPLYDFVTVQVLSPKYVRKRIQSTRRDILSSSLLLKFTPIYYAHEAGCIDNPTWTYPEDCHSTFTSSPPMDQGNGLLSLQRGEDPLKICSSAWNQMLDTIDDNVLLSDVGTCPLPTLNGLWLRYRMQIKARMREAASNPAQFQLLPQTLAVTGSRFIIAARDFQYYPSVEVQQENVTEEIPGHDHILNLLPVSCEIISKEYIFQLSMAEDRLFGTSLDASLGKPSSCNVVPLHNLMICGVTGSGKTFFSIALSAKLRMTRFSATVYLDCRQLQSAQLRMEEVLDELNGTFRRAYECQPSLLILDDLDVLVPNTGGHPGEDDSNVHHQPRFNAMLMNQVKLLVDHVRYLMARMRRSEVAILCTCADESKLHKDLRSVHAFTSKIDVKRLNGAEMYDLFASLVQRHGPCPWIESWTMTEFAKCTEGFLPRDLKVIAARVGAQQRKLSMGLWKDGRDCATLTKDEVETIISSYIPLTQQKLHLERNTCSIPWSKIGGLFRAKASLSDTILRPMKYRSVYQHSPVSLPRGILLYGYPGCGKSCIVPALAKQCGFNLVTCRGPELLDRYIGASEAKVRTLFEKAYSAAPAILFFDEFDALAPKRGSDNTGVTDRVVNQLLTFLDGVEKADDEMVYVIAASSRPDKIDPALLRPGRLEKHVFVGYPESEEEWNDQFTKISDTRNLDEESERMITDGSLIQTLPTLTKKCDYRKLSAADIKGVFDTAHLRAVHDLLADEKDGSCSEVVVQLRPTHLVHAFNISRPSISETDRLMLACVYKPFLGGDQVQQRERLGLDPKMETSASEKKLKTALK